MGRFSHGAYILTVGLKKPYISKFVRAVIKMGKLVSRVAFFFKI